jgi:hypothetical protein
MLLYNLVLARSAMTISTYGWGLLLLLTGCHPAAELAFTPPQLPQQVPSTALPPPAQATYVQAVFPPVVGRFSFAQGSTAPASAPETDYFREYAATIAARDSTALGTDGLEVLADYDRAVSYRRPGLPAGDPYFPARLVYPIYVLNATPRTKLLLGKDSWVFAIQEARDRSGYWRPIESRGYDFCGNGRWAIKLHPRQAMVVLMAKYQGAFRTLLRVRLINGSSLYVSPPYPGQVDERQFIVPPNQYHTLEKDLSAVYSLYYGATPAAVDSIQAQRYRQTGK